MEAQKKTRAHVHNRDRHAEILIAARAVFMELGYDSATTVEIARNARVAEGTIYRYASSKRHLFEQVIADWYAEMYTEMTSGIENQPTFKEKIAFAVAHQYKVFSDHGAIAQLMVREMRAKVIGQRGAIDDLNRRYTRVLLDLLVEGQKAGKVRKELNLPLVRDVFFGTIEHSAMRMTTSDQAKEEIETFTGVFWRLIVTRECEAGS